MSGVPAISAAQVGPPALRQACPTITVAQLPRILIVRCRTPLSQLITMMSWKENRRWSWRARSTVQPQERAAGSIAILGAVRQNASTDDVFVHLVSVQQLKLGVAAVCASPQMFGRSRSSGRRRPRRRLHLAETISEFWTGLSQLQTWMWDTQLRHLLSVMVLVSRLLALTFMVEPVIVSHQDLQTVATATTLSHTPNVPYSRVIGPASTQERLLILMVSSSGVLIRSFALRSTAMLPAQTQMGLTFGWSPHKSAIALQLDNDGFASGAQVAGAAQARAMRTTAQLWMVCSWSLATEMPQTAPFGLR